MARHISMRIGRMVRGASRRPLRLFFLWFLASPAFALRIVSLLPSNTEIVEALGAGDQLVGVTRYDTFPQGSKRANVGDLLTPQWEILLSLHPDLVLAGHWPSSTTVERLRSLNIRVIEIHHPSTLAEVEASIQTIGRELGLPVARADAVVVSMQNRLNALRQRASRRPTQRLYLEIDPPNWTIGSKDYLNEALSILHLENIFVSVPRKAIQVSSEAVVEKNPEIILVFHGSADAIRQRPGWGSVSAIQQGRVIADLSADDLVRPSPRFVTGLEKLCDRLEQGVSR